MSVSSEDKDIHAEFQRRLATLPSPEELFHNEIWWAQHYDWLKEQGYMMRPRYHPGWKALWLDTNTHTLESAEDSVVLIVST